MEEGLLTPEIMDAITVLIGAATAYLAYKVRQNEAYQKQWKAEEQAQESGAVYQKAEPTKPIGKKEDLESGSIALYENEYQSAEGISRMIKSIPAGADVLKVEEGVASNGSKYRVVYWKVTR